MKHIATTLFALMMSIITVSAQPNTKLRPDETVLLYADSFEGNIDPVYGKTIKYAGFEMAKDNGLSGEEKIAKTGNIGNIS